MRKPLLLAIAVLLFNGFYLYGQSRTERYDYPIKPRAEQWKELKSTEKAQAVIIPERVLKDLTTSELTHELTRTCLNFPFFHELTLDDLQKGFVTLKSYFNGFQELLTRKDVGIALLQIYKDMKVAGICEERDLIKQGDYVSRFTFIELLLAQKEILNKLTKEEKQILRQLALSTFEEKRLLFNSYGEFGLNTSALILARLADANGQRALLLKSVSQRDLDIYLNTGSFYNSDILAKIYNVSKAF